MFHLAVCFASVTGTTLYKSVKSRQHIFNESKEIRNSQKENQQVRDIIQKCNNNNLRKNELLFQEINQQSLTLISEQENILEGWEYDLLVDYNDVFDSRGMRIFCKFFSKLTPASKINLFWKCYIRPDFLYVMPITDKILKTLKKKYIQIMKALFQKKYAISQKATPVIYNYKLIDDSNEWSNYTTYMPQNKIISRRLNLANGNNLMRLGNYLQPI